VLISIADLEAAAAPGWRAPEEARLGDWLLRAASGFTGRANSALAIGDPGRPLPAAVAEVSRWYQARDLPVMIAVPFPPGNPQSNQVDQFLSECGWTIRAGAATVMTAEAALVARDTHAAQKPAPQATMAAEPDDDWLAMYHYRGQELPSIARRLLMSAPWQAFASVRAAGETIAIGRVAAAGDWAGLTAVEVHPDHRRRGLATAVTTALAAQAAARGVKGLYLQVENDNAAARALYHHIGFIDHHAYHYRLAPSP
jgi:ribosomal protein S18 acetylase RimI-like enzyme